jgi:hypothetical protein
MTHNSSLKHNHCGAADVSFWGQAATVTRPPRLPRVLSVPLSSVQLVLRYDGGHGAIGALTLSPEDCFLAGTADGSLLVYGPDPRRTITKRLPLTSGRIARASPLRDLAPARSPTPEGGPGAGSAAGMGGSAGKAQPALQGGTSPQQQLDRKSGGAGVRLDSATSLGLGGTA